MRSTRNSDLSYLFCLYLSILSVTISVRNSTMDDLLGNTTCSVVGLVAYVWFIRCWDGSIIGPVNERAHCHVQNDTPQSVVFFRWENTWNVHSHRRMTHQTLREQKTAHKKRQKKLQPTREPTIWGSDSNKKTTLKMKFSTSLYHRLLSFLSMKSASALKAAAKSAADHSWGASPTEASTRCSG